MEKKENWLGMVIIRNPTAGMTAGTGGTDGMMNGSTGETSKLGIGPDAFTVGIVSSFVGT
ncbi:hypothetical protein [Roseibium sp.]|uniref:hypothetical protein n=1 Tax=Roseibium sp. TaxID=1936156 RepID=UPI003BB10095